MGLNKHEQVICRPTGTETGISRKDLATLGIVPIPAALTDAIIALSILFLAAETVHKHNGVIGIPNITPGSLRLSLDCSMVWDLPEPCLKSAYPQHRVGNKTINKNATGCLASTALWYWWNSGILEH